MQNYIHILDKFIRAI